MYSQANVRQVRAAAPSSRHSPFAVVDTEKVLMGPLKVTPRRVSFGWKGVRSGVRLEPVCGWRGARRTQAKLEFSFKQNRSRVSSKNGGTSTGKPVSEANLMTCIERLQNDDLKSFSSAANRCTPDFSCAGGIVRCAPTRIIFCTVNDPL